MLFRLNITIGLQVYVLFAHPFIWFKYGFSPLSLEEVSGFGLLSIGASCCKQRYLMVIRAQVAIASELQRMY